MAQKTFTLEEVAKHNKDGDLWVVYKGNVLDLSSWADRHPGGKQVLIAVSGTDATDEMIGMHPPKVLDRLSKAFVKGGLAESDRAVPAHVQAYRDLVDEVYSDPDWMQTDYNYYYAKMPPLVGLLSFAVVLWVSGVGGYVATVLAGVCLGLFWQQALLVGHDAGHGGITHDSKKDFWIGFFVGTLSNGFSIMWWRKNHNTHHVATNSHEHDPDIQHLPFLAMSEAFFKSVYSTYYKETKKFDAFAKFLVMVQHVLFYPVMSVARFFVHVQGLLLLFNPLERVDNRWLEIPGMAFYFAWFWSLVLFGGADRSSGEKLAFVLSSHAMVGLLHVQITLNHFASDTHSDAQNAGSRGGKDFVTAQLDGTCDIICSESMDWLHGGLQFQVEHHLMPKVPRHNLRKLRGKVIQLCKDHDLPYVERTFYEANLCVYNTLKRVAIEARRVVCEEEGEGGLFVEGWSKSLSWLANIVSSPQI